jgi:hypothetical protein
MFHSCTVGSWNVVKGNHQIVNETIAIGDYDEIALSLSADVIYRQISQDEPFLQVSVDENLLEYLKIHVQGNRLIIQSKNNVNLLPSHFVIYTNSRTLSKVSIAGSGDVLLEKAVNARDMNVSITGSGELKTDSLYCENLGVNVTGSGDVTLNGAATNVQYRISGSGEIKAFDYLAENLDCRISGSGDIQAWVAKQLTARIAGSGDIRYKGHPESVDTRVSGSGEIRNVN